MFTSDTAFIIGNGKSRIGLDLERLKPYGYVIGCNALIRDFTPDYVVALDQKMEREIDASGYDGRKLYRHNNGQKRPAPRTRIEVPRGQTVNSGLAAIHLALKLKCHDLWLVGFDLNQQNIYAGTPSYARFSAKAYNSGPSRVQIHRTIGEWAKQLKDKVRFRRVYEAEWCYNPREWTGYVENVDVNEFVKLYNLAPREQVE